MWNRVLRRSSVFRPARTSAGPICLPPGPPSSGPDGTIAQFLWKGRVKRDCLRFRRTLAQELGVCQPPPGGALLLEFRRGEPRAHLVDLRQVRRGQLDELDARVVFGGV